MGLDISLCKLPAGVTLEQVDAIEAEYEKRCDEAWEAVGGYSAASEDQKDAVRAKVKAIAAEMGLGEYGKHPARADAHVPVSKVDPGHMFRLNYLRSSYNGSGINRVLRDAGVMSLYGIFTGGEEEDPQYRFVPDWAASLERVDAAIAAWRQHIAAPGGNVRVMELRHNMFMALDQLRSSEAVALEIYRREAAKEHTPDFMSYGNRDGEFYLDGLTVRALIPGVTRGILSGQPEHVVYAVIDAAVEAGHEDWHLTALKITREMIEFVLAQPDRDAYYLTWSA